MNGKGVSKWSERIPRLSRLVFTQWELTTRVEVNKTALLSNHLLRADTDD